MNVMRVNVKLPDAATAARFEKACKDTGIVQDIEAWPDRAEIAVIDGAKASVVRAALEAAGFDVSPAERGSRTVAIDGMTCRSCEITVERRFKKLPGVLGVRVDAAKGHARIEHEGPAPEIGTLAEAVRKDGYVVRGGAPRAAGHAKPSLLELAGLFVGVLLLARALQAVGFFSTASSIDLGKGVGFAAAFVIGLVAGSSSCLAVSGGLMLSMAAKYRERYGEKPGIGRMTPVFAFLGGRVASYAVLGGAIGALGRALTPSPLATGMVTVVAALAMIVMGLDILGIAPAWLKGLMPRMPKALAHRVMDEQGREHPAMPLALGAATFFIPCGFTQALQIYALTAGGFLQGALILGGFALGTAPALFALGLASNALKGRSGRLFLRFTGAVVVVLGLWNVQNGLTAAGHPLSLPSFAPPASAARADAPDANVVKADGRQRIVMKLTASSPYYWPSDRYTVEAGVPVDLEVDGVGTGCRTLFQIPGAGVSMPLTKSVNTLSFTPDKPGQLTFSCAMGMYRGTIVVVPSKT